MSFKLNLLYPVFAFVLLFTSCSKGPDNLMDPGNPNLKIYLVDCPINADEINIEIKQVIISNGTDELVIIPELEGKFNLLDYQNGVNALLVSENITLPEVSSINLVLDDDIEIVVAGVAHQVEMPEAFDDGMTLGTNVVIVDGQITELTIDFDACQSIIRTPDGEYVMKPHLNLFDEDGDDIDDNDDDGNAMDEDDDDEIDYDDMEDIVEAYLAANLDTSEFVNNIKEVELCEEFVVYVIDIVNLNNEESRVVIDEIGESNLQFGELQMVDIMPEIKNYMNDNYAEMSIDNAVSVTLSDGSIFYNLEVESTNDKEDELELIFNAEGQWVCTIVD